MGEEENSPGSEEVVETTVEETPVAEAPQEDSIHPAWNDMLEALPSSLHSIVTPHLRQRDKSYQDGINKVHSQYEAYKPYVDNQIGRDKIDYALQIMEAVETRPAEMIKALQAYTGMSKEEATKVVADNAEEPGQVETELPEELLNHPKFQEMQTMIQTVAQHLVSQKQTEEQSKQDQELAEELETLKQTHGEYDEEYVLTWAMAHPDKTLDDAVKAYKEKIQEAVIASRRPPAPKVLGQGGGTVDNQITQSDLVDPKARKALVQQMLAASKSQ